ncbi:MAG: hypothetical protein L6R40_007445 [Gallowayella cf. fulva]|nr:MAG: hypothetical protein L6R40_007445 [Xanthomendoza cf. fulva]
MSNNIVVIDTDSSGKYLTITLGNAVIKIPGPQRPMLPGNMTLPTTIDLNELKHGLEGRDENSNLLFWITRTNENTVDEVAVDELEPLGNKNEAKNIQNTTANRSDEGAPGQPDERRGHGIGFGPSIADQDLFCPFYYENTSIECKRPSLASRVATPSEHDEHDEHDIPATLSDSKPVLQEVPLENSDKKVRYAPEPVLQEVPLENSEKKVMYATDRYGRSSKGISAMRKDAQSTNTLPEPNRPRANARARAQSFGVHQSTTNSTSAGKPVGILVAPTRRASTPAGRTGASPTTGIARRSNTYQTPPKRQRTDIATASTRASPAFKSPWDVPGTPPQRATPYKGMIYYRPGSGKPDVSPTTQEEIFRGSERGGHERQRSPCAQKSMHSEPAKGGRSVPKDTGMMRGIRKHILLSPSEPLKDIANQVNAKEDASSRKGNEAKDASYRYVDPGRKGGNITACGTGSPHTAKEIGPLASKESSQALSKTVTSDQASRKSQSGSKPGHHSLSTTNKLLRTVSTTILTSTSPVAAGVTITTLGSTSRAPRPVRHKRRPENVSTSFSARYGSKRPHPSTPALPQHPIDLTNHRALSSSMSPSTQKSKRSKANAAVGGPYRHTENPMLDRRQAKKGQYGSMEDVHNDPYGVDKYNATHTSSLTDSLGTAATAYDGVGEAAL